MNKLIRSLTYKLRLLLASVLLLGIQSLAPISALTSTASAAPICVTDTAGANDEPGQKDLTKLCVDYAGAPTTVATTWNWDETGTNGANTMDACNLFDNDNNGNIDYAVCVTTQDDPAVLQTINTYTCGDAKIDRCTTPSAPVSTTGCAVSQVNTDPFPSGASYPKDTQGNCTVQLSTVGGASAKLVDVCSYPSGQPNSDPSDCVIARDNSGKVELIKDIVPNSDTGLFNLTIDGPAASGDVTTVNNVGDNGTTGEVVVGSGSVVVKETAGTNTSLTSYNTTIVCKDLNGTGSIVGQGSPTGASSRQLTFTLADQADVVCTATNTRQQSTLILQKTVVNDNGGTLTQSNFPVAISGNAAQWGSNSVSPGTYTVSETQQTGYTAGAWGGDCDAQGNVTLTDGQTKTCTITNNDVAPSLTLNKVVSNTHGGTAVESNWTLTADGSTTDLSGPGAAGSADVVSGPTFAAGTYTLSESTGPSGYSASAWSCTNGVTVSNSQITLALGQTTVCTITNSDTTAQLTVIKHVINNDGGTSLASAFTMNVTANNPSDDSFPGAESPGTTIDLNAGSYSVGETGPSGYAASYSTDCSGTIAVGQSKTCTVTNNDIAPILTVIKYVVNDNGGLLNVGDFSLYVDSTQVISGVPNLFDAGAHLVSEVNQPGYTAGAWGGNCDAQGNITLSIGGQYTCTITNSDNAPSLTLNKVVVNNNGGNATESNWTLNAVGSSQNPSNLSGPGAAGDNDVVSGSGFKADTYTLSEAGGPNGYSASSWTCTNGVTVNGSSQITLGLGQTTVCTITNDDAAPQLTVIKHVENDNNGDTNAEDFTMDVTGTNVSDPSFPGDEAGTTVTLNAGSYSVGETGPSGYAASYSTDCSGTISVGEHKTCTITNDDVAPKLTIVKKAYPLSSQVFDFSSDSQAIGDFSLTGDDTASSSQQFTLNAGEYSVSELATEGWILTNIRCWGTEDYDTDIEDGSLTVNLHVGNNVTCKFYNDKLNTISGYKFNDLNGNGEWDQEEPGLEGWTINLTRECPEVDIAEVVCQTTTQSIPTDENGAYVFDNLYPDAYTVCEELQDHWMQTYPDTKDGCHELFIEGPGEDLTADFGNFRLGEVKGVKFNDVNGNGHRDQGEPTLKDWEITLTKKCVSQGQDLVRVAECQDTTTKKTTDATGAYSFGDLEPGDYTACETQKSNWTQTYPTTNGGCHQFTIDQSGQIVTADFGNKPKPQVLSEELVNTGAPVAQGFMVGLAILSTLGALHLVTRRNKNYAK
jgi:hypothetical protein